MAAAAKVEARKSAAKDEADSESAAPAAKAQSNVVRWVLIGAIALVVMGGSIGGALYLLGPADADAPKAATAATAAAPQVKPAIYQDMKPSFIVHFMDGQKPRYLQVELSVMSRDQAVMDAIKVHAPLIRGQIIDAIGRYPYSALGTDEGKQRMREDLRALIETIVAREAHVNGVEAVLLTNFVMQ